MPTTESRYWDFETTFHQNEAQTAKAIKEVRAHCVTAIWDAEATCTAAIGEAEAACTKHAHILQQSHRECMQEMQREAIEEEGRDCQSFLTACGVVLQVCPPEAHGVLMCPLQLLMGNMSLATLLTHSSQSSTAKRKPAPETPSPTALAAPLSKQWWHSSGEEGTGPATPPRELTHWKWREGRSLTGLKENIQEAFCQDSNLVQVTRWRYSEVHNPTFDQEGSNNLSGLFQEMVTCANLLDSEIYKTQEARTSQRDLWYTNDALKVHWRVCSFFCPVSPLESLKVMDLQGIHYPKALCHHVELSYCPWCGKEGQNEGTVVNHLWTTHYKLGLVCSGCLCFPSITAEAIQHHGPGCKGPGAEDDGKHYDDDSSSSD